MSRKKRESYISYDKEAFLNKETGPYTRLDNTAWYLKKKNCFKATAERTAELNVPAIRSQIKEFMEVTNESN